MSVDGSQLTLWPHSMERSPSGAQSWPRSSGPETRSPDAIDATSTPRSALASHTPRSVARADTLHAGASRMVRPRQLRLISDDMSTMSTGPDGSPVPRPTTRGECLLEARPCPWVACKHHLLLTVAGDRLRLNRPSRSRRPSLSPRASDDEVALFVDDAVELLSLMTETCSLDVSDRVAQEGRQIGRRRMGKLLGMTPAGAQKEIERAEALHRECSDGR